MTENEEARRTSQQHLQTQASLENVHGATPEPDLGATGPQVEATPGKGDKAAGPPLGSIAGYEVLEELGRGGMGVVYKARQEGLNRLVALKMILAGKHASDEHRARFQSEAAAVARLEHPNIVPVYAVGTGDGLPYFSMQLLEGGSLARRLKGDPLLVDESAVLVKALAEATEAGLHRGGVVHRDLKPGNVLFATDGTPKITDFGLAKFIDLPDGLTASNVVIGTPGYLAPEQASGKSKEAGPAADIYALGAILYECLSGVPPFQGHKGIDALLATLQDEPVPPSHQRPGLPADLVAVCLKCLAKDPSQRYPSAQTLADDLGRWLGGESTQARPRRWPARLWRAVRRRPVTALGLVFCALLATAGALGIGYTGSDRSARVMQGELALGQAVNLLGSDGEPRWRRWRVAHGGFRGLGDSRALSLQSFDLALLELLPGTKHDRFRFKAEVRQDQGNQADVGLFVSLTSVPTSRGDIVCFYSLTFNDLAPTGCQVVLNLWARSDVTPGDQFPAVNKSIRGGPSFSFSPSREDGGRGPWRKLAVEVTPERVRTFWEGQRVHELTREGLQARIRNWLVAQPDLNGLGVEFNPTGGLGLFLDEGAAAFRNVVIEPMALGT